MENLVKEEISWLKQLLSNPHIGILVTDINRNIVFVNEYFCRKIGYTKEELIGQPARIFHVDANAYEKFYTDVLLHLKEGKSISIDYEVLRKDGAKRWVTISGNFLNDEKEFLWSVVDITDRVENERKLLILKERMELALSGYNAGLWEWNITDGTIYVSQEWKNMLGYEDSLFVDLSLWKEKIHPEDRGSLMQNIENAINQRETKIENIHRLQHSDGHWIWILCRATIIYEVDGSIRIVGIHTDITNQKNIEDELSAQKQKLEYLAHHDVLTDLPNRLLFHDRLEHSIEKAKRDESTLAVLFLDLDHFKEINDSFGHDTGDEVLKVVTKRFLERIRKEDTLARLGGDEFAIIMEGLKDSQDAVILAQTIVDIFKVPIILDDYSFYLSCSIGISLFPEDDDDAKNLLKYADAAMYKAKENGRNGYAFYQEEMTHAALQKVVIETELRNALQENELRVYYQLQMNAKEDAIIGMEALVRWQHAEVGFLTPDRFLSVAESSGLIVEVDRYVMKRAIAQIVAWHKEGLNPGVLALNISVQQLIKDDFVFFVKSMLRESGCKPEWLEFEVTESGLMKNPADSIKILQELNNLGIELAVDDFGTGYSSLSYLKKLPINRLKIDKSFVNDLPYDEEDVAITKAVIALAKSLNLKVIAEGVETHAQKEFLVSNGCEKIQGYLYGKPISAADMEALLLKIK